MKYYPTFMRLTGRNCLVVGGGAVATQKVHGLLAAGADRVLGLDRDRTALELAANNLRDHAGRVEFVHADYRTLGDVLDARAVLTVDGGILADLGVSSMQLDDADRGFSFRADAPLDMRMDRDSGSTASEMLQVVEEHALADIIYQYGEERFSRRIARAIVHAREQGPIATTGQLATIVRRAVPTKGWQRIDPATRTFQAIRIWVNRELDGLDAFIRLAVSRLRAGARLAIIAFHSLEDRIVKHTFRALAQADEPSIAVITRRPIEAGEDEIARNPRARSAKLRVAERLA